jgi:flagellin-specific chaperone FliS
MSNQTPCPGCDGHECDDGCQYPGVVTPKPRSQSDDPMREKITIYGREGREAFARARAEVDQRRIAHLTAELRKLQDIIDNQADRILNLEAALAGRHELSWETLRSAYNAIHEEAQRQHIIPWGAMVSVRDVHNFIQVAYRAIIEHQKTTT